MKRIGLVVLILMAATMVIPVGCGWMEDPEIRVLKAMVADLQLEQAAAKQERIEERQVWAAQMEKMQHTLKVLTDQKAKLKESNEELFGILAKSTGQVDDMREIIESREDKKLVQFEVAFDNNQLYNKARTAEIATYVLTVAKRHDFKVKLIVEGYTTIAGEATHNMWLSKERAEGVFHKIMSVADGDATKFDHTHIIAHGEESDNERKVVVTLEVL